MLFGKTDPRKKFWSWFAANADKVRLVKTGQEPIVGPLSAELRRVHKDLVWEMGGAKDGCLEFTVSAGGISSVIPEVEALVAAAPSIPGWKVSAFKQRHPEGLSVQTHGRKLGPESVFYVAQKQGEKLDLWLYIDGLDASNKRDLMGACFILLDSQIGEYDAMTRIGKIEFLPLMDADGRQRPLTALAEDVDNLKQ